MICRKCHSENPPDARFCCYCGASAKEKPRSTKKRGNGQGTVFQLKNGSWIATQVVGWYSDENGVLRKKTVSKCFAKKSDAIMALPTLKNLPAKVKDITLHDLYESYVASKEYSDLSASQRQKLGYAWNRWADLEFRGIGTLTVDDMETAIESQTSSYYPARDMKVLLSHLFKLAIKKEIVSQNKTDYVDIPFDLPKAKRECWTQAEIAALWLEYQKNPFAGYILIMCYAGLRYGELATIQLENIHLEENYMIGGIKTDAGINREIPIHEKLKPIISQIVATSKRKLLEMNEDRFYEKYWETIRRAGMRELPPHTCRHYFFSRMTSAGVQGGIIAEVGGHANYLTTLKNYVRVPLDDKLKAVNSI